MRILDRALSAALALALLAGGLVTAVELVLAGFDRSPWLIPYDRWLATARTTPWSDAGVRLFCAGLVVAGLSLLVVEGLRRRPDAFALAAQGSGVAAELDRRKLERWLVEQVEQVEGVVHAGAKVGARAAMVEVSSVGRDTAPVAVGVKEHAGRCLDQLGLDRPPRLRVKVRPPSAAT